MKNYVLYEGSGRIAKHLYCPEDAVEANTEEGQTVLECGPEINATDYYVNTRGRKLIPKSQFELHYKDTQEVGSLLTIAHVPEGTRVIWPDGEETVETDGIVECELAYVGEYLFEFRHAKFFTTKVTIHVPA